MNPEQLAALRKLLAEHEWDPETGWCCLELPFAAAEALPALLNATDELLVCKAVARGHLELADRRAAERDALAAKVARVRVLADHTEGATHRCNPGNVWECPGCWSDRLRAALDEEADHA